MTIKSNAKVLTTMISFILCASSALANQVLDAGPIRLSGLLEWSGRAQEDGTGTGP